MKIIKADKTHKQEVLLLLDNFRNVCYKICGIDPDYHSDTARTLGGDVFDRFIDSNDFAIFLAVEAEKYIGVATVYKIPLIRKGVYDAEIIEFYVEEKFQGSGAAQLLMDSVVTWAKESKIANIKLESDNELYRAHGFYEKYGFKNHAKAFKLNLN